jgi:Na+/proline symporter
MPAVFAGLIAGVATAVFLMLSHRDPLFGLSAGFLALCLNFSITVFLSLLTPTLFGKRNKTQYRLQYEID